MSDEVSASDGQAPAMASATDHELSSHSQQPIHISSNPPIYNASRKSTLDKSEFEVQVSGIQTPMSQMGGQRGSRHKLDLDEYFVCLLLYPGIKANWRTLLESRVILHFQVGPLDLDAHSKLPFFMRMHGSVLPRMILPLIMITAWASLITCISKFVHDCPLPSQNFSQ